MSTATLYPSRYPSVEPAEYAVRVTPTPLGEVVRGPWADGQAPSAEARTVVRPVGELRLTRRGRLAVFLACVAVVLGAAFFLGASSVATEEPAPASATEVVTVATGETLWDLAAERTEPGEDVRETMLRIERLNALQSAALDAGQRLLVPVQSGLHQ